MPRQKNTTLTSKYADMIVPGRSFALAGPRSVGETAALPVRGDLAHVRLAGQVFVPHYAMPSAYRACHAVTVLANAQDDAEPTGTLAAGETFEVLDILHDWAWGVAADTQAPDAGQSAAAVGYVRLSALEPLA